MASRVRLTLEPMKTTPVSLPHVPAQPGAEAHAVSNSSGMLAGLVGALKTLVYQSLLFLVSLLPTRLAYRMACAVGRIRHRRQKQARHRLAQAMQSGLGASPQEIEEWVRQYF